jgi:hypothetical protein
VSATIVERRKRHKLAAVQFWYRDEEGRRSSGKAETCIKEFYEEQGNEFSEKFIWSCARAAQRLAIDV